MITMRLEGNALASDVFKNVIRNTNDRKIIIKEVIRPAAKIVNKVMKNKAPVMTGHPAFNVYRDGKIYVSIKPKQLKKSVGIFTTPSTRKAGALNIGPRYKKGVWTKPDRGGWFMHMVQFGTEFVKPQPFVLQALLSTKSGVGNLMVKGMEKRLRKVVSKDGKGILVMA
jgi:HK97 gp10 family phage protein|tara:strand:+ start:207 stop:713 length:507 start_codon:yes stop_codon:yes gene_type:complete